jgi:hypothetical protein
MIRRTEKTTERKLEVQWSTERWTPAIQSAPANGTAQHAIRDMVTPFTFRRPPRRKPSSILWVRNGHTISSNGNRLGGR